MGKLLVYICLKYGVVEMSFTYKTSQSQEEMLRKTNAHLKVTGYKVKTRGYVLEGTNGRDYSTAWCILFFLLGIIPFLIYWFTRKKNRITLTCQLQEVSQLNMTVAKLL